MIQLFLFVGFCVCAISGLDEFEQVSRESAMFPTLPIVALWSENEQCRNDSWLLMENLRNSTTWAMQMLESSARSAVGVLKGRVYQLGDFDECVETVSPIQGRYCLATVTVSSLGTVAADTRATDFYNPTASAWDRIRNNVAPTRTPRNVVYWALCVPASCSHGDVQASIDRHLSTTPRTTNGTSIHVQVDAALCGPDGEVEDFFTYGTVAYCCVLAVIVIVVLSSTICDVLRNKSQLPPGNEGKRALDYFLCFSLRKNFLELPELESSNRALDCLCGIKLVSLFVVIICHRIGLTIGAAVQNTEFVERQSLRFDRQLLFQGDVAVDTFFILSGLLFTYILLVILDRTRVNLLQAFVLRFFRLTPAYILVVFFSSTLMYHMGDGPLWNAIIGLDRDACRENWWTNLLYINNYVNPERICMIHSWFLPCDTHFFIVGLFIVKLLHSKPHAGCVVLGLATLASVLVPFTITFIGQKAPLLFFQREFLASPRSHEVFNSFYVQSHNRASPYLVGMVTGYFLFRTRKYEKKCTWLPRLGMLVALVLCSVVLTVGNLFYAPWWEYDVMQAALYAGLHHFVWAVGMAVFMLSMIFNENSMLGALMSWSPVVPLSKLVYSTYLVHMVMQTMQIASIRTPENMIDYNVIHDSVGDIACSMAVALVLYLTVEAPVRHIIKLLMAKEVNTKPDEDEETERRRISMCLETNRGKRNERATVTHF